MGVGHRELPVHGVQFHPESVLTEVGLDLLATFLRMTGRESGQRGRPRAPRSRRPAMPNDVLSAALAELAAGRDLAEADARDVLLEIMGGRTGDAQTGAFLSALRVKGETVDEIVGMARAMSELAEKVDVDADVILDTCGTGGDALRHLQHLHRGGVRRRRRRRHGGQARQPLGDEQVRQRRRARGARRRHRPRARQVSRCIADVRHRLHVRAASSPGDEARRRRCAASSAWRTIVQPPRAADQPRRRAPPAHRRGRRPLRRPHRAGGAHDGQRAQPGRPRRRRAGRDLDHRRDRASWRSSPARATTSATR